MLPPLWVSSRVAEASSLVAERMSKAAGAGLEGGKPGGTMTRQDGGLFLGQRIGGAIDVVPKRDHSQVAPWVRMRAASSFSSVSSRILSWSI